MAIVSMITAPAIATSNARTARYATEVFAPQAVEVITNAEKMKFAGTGSVFLDVTSMKNALPARSA